MKLEFFIPVSVDYFIDDVCMYVYANDVRAKHGKCFFWVENKKSVIISQEMF